MTRVTDKFGALAFAILAVFALWTSTLSVPFADATGTATQQTATVVG